MSDFITLGLGGADSSSTCVGTWFTSAEDGVLVFQNESFVANAFASTAGLAAFSCAFRTLKLRAPSIIGVVAPERESGPVGESLPESSSSFSFVSDAKRTWCPSFASLTPRRVEGRGGTAPRGRVL
jgi:hypothetical protein